MEVMIHGELRTSQHVMVILSSTPFSHLGPEETKIVFCFLTIYTSVY
jgi:hypothetical protein